MPEIRMKPDITPSPEGEVGILPMVKGQARFEIPVAVSSACGFNGSPGKILAKNMGGQGNHPPQPRARITTGMDQGDGTAVGMADKKMVANAG